MLRNNTLFAVHRQSQSLETTFAEPDFQNVFIGGFHLHNSQSSLHWSWDFDCRKANYAQY